MVRLRKLRLEKEAAEKLAVASKAVTETESAALLRERSESVYPEQYQTNAEQIRSHHLRINAKHLIGMAHETRARWRSLLIVD